MWRGALLLLAAAAWVRAGPGPPAPTDDPPDAPDTPDATDAPHAAHDDSFHFTHQLYNLTIPENSAPRTYALQPPDEEPLGVRPPAGARVRFRVRHGDKDRFFKAEERCVGDFCFLWLRTRAGHADVLNRERRDAYRLQVRATATLPGGAALRADTELALAVSDVDDLSPLFYPTEYEVTVAEDAPAHSSVARVTAEDADLGLNGEIYYSFTEPTDRFAVHPTSGVVSITRPLVLAEAARHELTVLARDRAALMARGELAPAARAKVTVRVRAANLHAPEMRARTLSELAKADVDQLYAIIEASDIDEGEHGRIADVDIVDGDPDGHFRIRNAATGEYHVLAHPLRDSASSPERYNLTLRARDAGVPQRAAYLTLEVRGPPPPPAPPVFARELYEAAVSENAPPHTPLVRLKVAERDARVHIEIVGGNEGGEFHVHPDTGVLYTAAPLDAERRAHYTLTVSAVDAPTPTPAAARRQSSAKVKVTVLDANDNDPVFDEPLLSVTVDENGPAGSLVARLAARDADSGENAYISYSLANLQPVPFDVEHFTGAVRTSRVLDYESMRRSYVLRVRASDWGSPYRRRAEAELRVTLRDVNDNRPQFERVECVAYVPRRLPPATPLLTLSAVDFDAGDAVSYRLLAGNDDGCFSLDTTSGVLSVSCDLTSAAGDVRRLNITATDGAHFADETSVLLHLVNGAGSAAGIECRETGAARRLAELLAAAARASAPDEPEEPEPSRRAGNLHTPDFIDFPVEVKVNESVALGTVLLRVRARDRDRSYDGLVVYGLSGGDDDSAFRLDPETGELRVIGHLDREREAEYYLNVTAYDCGSPRRAASRLLPVTVLDVNDNSPRFDRSLASYRVAENALNGTAVCRLEATDEDAGEFGRVTYSLEGAGADEFCVDRGDGTVRVCGPLDRERRELYELAVVATDGGGRSAEARVRITVDDVNDCAPEFALASFAARVPEDLPVGSVVGVVEAHDPDSGAGGRLTYSLPEQPLEDAYFSVDAASGVVRLARALDYEERQVHGVGVRATDGGGLAAEAALVVEVLDVDENVHAPVFEQRVLAAAVREDAAPGSLVLAVRARDADPPGRDSRLSYYAVGGSGLGFFTIDDAGEVRTLAPLDREAAAHYWLTVCAEDHALLPKHACIQVYIEVEDVNDVRPWMERAQYSAELDENAPGGTRVAAVRAADGDAAPAPHPLRYRIVAGNPDGLFTIDEITGVVTTTGRALDREAAAQHALELEAWDGAWGGAARLSVALRDANDHAPAFTQRYYQLRAPAAPAPAPDDYDLALPQGDAAAGSGAGGAGGGGSGEADSEDEDEAESARDPFEALDDDASGTPGLYVGTVLALDPDAGANGSVSYSAGGRGAARGALRVARRSGRLYAVRPLRPDTLLDLTVRACDGGRPARCGVARVSVRGVAVGVGGGARAHNAPPALPPPPPLTVAELDAPGFLLALLQASDPDDDPLYYDIVDGDPRGEFYLGREDGSLVLARRLLWERQPRYELNVSVSDARRTTYAAVHVNVVNDAHEGGVAFSRELYVLDVGEDARVGEPLATLRAAVQPPPGVAAPSEPPRVLYGVLEARAPASLPLFRLDELTGVLELAKPLDREAAAEHELTVWARDTAPRASRALARVLVRVHDVDEHAPEWGRRLLALHVARGAIAGAVLARLRAADRDAAGREQALHYDLVSSAGGLFALHPTLGELSLARALPAAGAGPREYTLQARAAAAAGAGAHPAPRQATLPLHVTVLDEPDQPPRFSSSEVEWSVDEDASVGSLVGVVSASGAGVQYALLGGEGRFRLDPAAGALRTAARLDHEARRRYNLTLTARGMGGGQAAAAATVHVRDRNECPPRLARAAYAGSVSEGAAPGALVRAPSGEPLVLDTLDDDSPANRQRAFRIVEPDAAAVFRVHEVTGALLVAAPLDHEARALYEFTVRVLDAGTPPLTASSAARVTVQVTDENDCAPRFEHELYSATLLLPSAAGARVLALPARDPDTVPPDPPSYDILEGDPEGAFSMDASGWLRVARPELVRERHALRVRASDGVHASWARVGVSSRRVEGAGLAFRAAEYWASVLENETRAQPVLVLDVLGAALDEHVHFRLLNPVVGFEMGATSGALRTTGVPLDREVRDNYTLLVEAVGGVGGVGGEGGEGEEGRRVARALVQVTVLDVNDNCPVFVGLPYEAAVRAGDPPGTHVTQVEAIDIDAGENGEVRYEMKRGHGELFRVDRATGAVSLRQGVERARDHYTLLVAAFDGGAPACGAEAEVTVRVWAGGAAPRWAGGALALSVREDAAPGTRLQPALAAESPLQRALIYTLLDDAALPDFALDFDTAHGKGIYPCYLVVAGALDREGARGAVRTGVVRAADGVTGAHADAALRITLEDVNDCAPRLDAHEYRVSVPEDAERGRLLLTVNATDDDEGVFGEVEFSLWWAEESGAGAAAGGNASAPPFSIDAYGALRVAAPLDAETVAVYRLRLTARDRAPRPLETHAHVFITVEDVNDNAPRMVSRSLELGVWGGAARGAALGAVRARDADAADGARLRYALHGGDPPAPPYAVHPITGLIELTGPPAAATLNISVSDGAHADFARVRVVLTPDNRHAPAFAHVLYEARVKENLPPPQLLTTVVAADDDEGELGAVTYWIPSQRLRDTFTVDARSGALSTRVPLDREARAEWLVPVAASDGAGLLAHTTVRVRVLDVNEHAPAFPLGLYRAAAAASRAPGAVLAAPRAADADEPERPRLRYELLDSLEGGDHPAHPAPSTRGLLQINPDTGDVSFARNASEFAGQTVSVWVVARDGGGLAGRAALSLRLLARGERAPPPPAPRQDLFLREDAVPGTMVAELRPAEGAADVTYRLAEGAARDMFLVEGSRLVLAGALDREAAPAPALLAGLEAELGGVRVTSTLRLRVLDVNDNAPVFQSQPYRVTLAENAPPGTSVLQVMAEDADAGSNGEVRYSLVAESEGESEGLFTLDAASGWLVTARGLDRERAPEHRLGVVARDAGAPPRSARGSVLVRLRDYNDCPPVFAADSYAASVAEDAAPGTVLLRLSATDGDVGAGGARWALLAGDARAQFSLRAAGAGDAAELLVARPLDREAQARYTLRVLVTDGKFSAETEVHVEVTDVNDNPPYCEQHRYTARVSEAAGVGTRVLRVVAHDADAGAHARTRYYLTGDGAAHWRLNEASGEVTVGAPLDREARALYSLTAHAADAQRPDWECRAELLLALDDVNDNAPRFTAARYDATLPEDAEPGTLVAKVHATDPDLAANRLLRYELEEPSATFRLDARAGILTLAAPLDRETAPRHEMRVRVTDAGSPPLSASALVRLTVADVNDNPPRFERREYACAVSELAAPGAELLRVHATSEDAGVNADVYYSIVGGDERGLFELDARAGVLRLARPLDRELAPLHRLTLQALDGGEPPLSDLAAVNVTVLDANDNAPVFLQASYSARVREDAAPGAAVLQVRADDADEGANGRVSYSIVRGDDEHQFAVDPLTGHVSVAAGLDREARDQYELELRATDGGAPALWAAARVRVTVLDANDHAPRCENASYSCVVRSGAAAGATLLRLRVLDEDAPPHAAPFTFDFHAGDERGAFRLEQDGTLRTAKPLDHRIKDHYLLHVRVFDNGSPPLFGDCSVGVRVVERSRFPPVATPLDVLLLTYRDQFPGADLAAVRATDRDPFDTLSFALTPPHALFRVHAATGVLSAAPRPDPGDYTLNLTVSDGTFATSAPVRVRVRLLTDDLLAHAVLVRFRAVSPEDFVLSHRKGFLRAVREAADCPPERVLLLSVRPSAERDDERDNEVRRRRRRQVAGDLDVAVVVRGEAGGAVPADTLRRRLHAHLERLEERARLVVEELVRAPCPPCPRAACRERLQVTHARAVRAVACDVFALVGPPLRARATCEGEGEEEAPAVPEPVLQLGGDGYLALAAEATGAAAAARPLADELTLSFRFRTRWSRGTLLWAAGRVDRLVLELVEGVPRLTLELGSGVGVAALGARVDDGAWHSLRLERRGGWARLQVDRQSAHAHGPPPAASLDLDEPRLLLGAALLRHAHALAPEQVTRGFVGCLSELRAWGAPLPLEEGGGAGGEGGAGDGRLRLLRRVRVRAAADCAPLEPPGACAAYPCQHGGTCHEREDGDQFSCACHERYAGERCERDTDPCASAPCLHGGYCSALLAPAPDEPPYACQCGAGLAGARCERGRYCGGGGEVCAHGGECEEGAWGPVCRCRGYFGPRCQYDVDECAGEPCLNGATCLNEPGSFRCLCPPDKTGMNCGNPLYSDAVTLGGGGGGGDGTLGAVWRWAAAAGWPLWAGGAAAAALLLLGAALALLCRRGARREPPPPPPPLNCDKLPPRSKLSNLAVGRGVGAGAGAVRAPDALNNMDTLRSYGSAGDELELPRDYLRNLNVEGERKPWSEQMHLHTFTDHKIYNDLKAASAAAAAAASPLRSVRRAQGMADEAGVYHWDCSDWCGAPPNTNITEVGAHSERRDSSSPHARPPRAPRAPHAPPSATDTTDHDDRYDFADGCLYPLHPDQYLPPACGEGDGGGGEGERAPRLREPDAASLITMLEERHSLLGGGGGGAGGGSCSDVSARLCEISDSEEEEEEEEEGEEVVGEAGGARHTAV